MSEKNNGKIRLAMAETLRELAVEKSPFDPNRNYIGLSNIHECVRALWFKINSDEPGRVIRSQKMIAYESYREQRHVIADLKAKGWKITSEEMSIHDFNNDRKLDPLIDGHIEGIILHNGSEILLEVKVPRSMHVMNRVIRERKVPLKVYDQVQLYMNYTKLESAVVIYKNIFDCDYFDVTVFFNDKRVKTLLKKIDDIIKIVTKDELPEVERNIYQDRECKLCQFRYICKDKVKKQYRFEKNYDRRMI